MDWYPPEYERRTAGEVLMEFPKRIKSMLTIGARLFVTLDSGEVIEVTELLGEPKH